MNMISTGAFLNEMDASSKQPSTAEKFAAVWEKKNAKAARAGGVSLMALSLAACGGSSSTTTTTTDTTTVTTPVTPATPASQSFTLTSGVNDFTGGDGADSFTAATAAVLQGFDALAGGAGTDSLTVSDTLSTYEGSTGLSGTISGIENLTISTSGGVGTATGAATTQTGAKAVRTVTLSNDAGTDGITALTITLDNGASYAISGVTEMNSQAELYAGVKTMLKDAFGSSVTVSTVSSNAFTVTSTSEGVALPNFSITTNTQNAINVKATITVAETTAPKETIVNTGSDIYGIQTITLNNAGDGLATGDKVYAHVDGARIQAYTGGTSFADAATAVAKQINAMHGADIATAVGAIVTVKGTAGTPLPLIGASIDDAATTIGANTATTAVLRGSSDTVAAGASEVVFDASGFAGEVNLTVADNAVVKAAATADVTVTSSKGSVDIDGGATVTVTGVDAVDIMGDKVTSATVKTGTATGDNVNIGAVTGTAADTPILTTATVTGGYDVVVTDYKSGTSAKTLTSVTLNGVGNSATLDGDALTTINLGAAKVSSTITLDNNATDAIALTLTAADTGIDADGNDQVVSVVADNAASIALTAGGTDNAIKLGDNTTANTVTKSLTVGGSGNISLDVSGVELTALKTISAAGATGNVDFTELADADVTLTGGAGDDSVTLANAKKVTVDMGAGADEVTVTASLAVGATVTGGSGEDTLIVGDSAVVDTALEADKFSSFEVFKAIDNNATAEDYDLSKFSSVNKVIVGAVDDASDDVTLTDMSAAQAANVHVHGDNAGFLALDLKTDTGTSDTATVTLGDGKKTNEAFDIGEGITFNGIETLNLVALPGATVTAAADKVATIASFTSDVGTAINLTGTEFTLSNIATTKAVTIDGTALTEGLTVDGQAVAKSTIKGSDKDDVFKIDAVGSTYEGNAGKDSFEALTSAILHTNSTSYTTITGGAGEDTLKTTDAAHTLVDDDFTGVSGVEKLTMDVDGAGNATSVTGAAKFSEAFASGVTIDADTGATTATFDFSGASVAVTIDLNTETQTDDVVVKTGSAADTVTIANTAGTTAKTTVQTGAGDDTITIDLTSSGNLNIGGAGDTLDITGGKGKDTITVTDDNTYNADHFVYIVAAGDSTIANFDVIKGFTLHSASGAASKIDFDGGSNDHATAVTNQAVSGYTAAQLLLTSAADGLVTFSGTSAATVSLDTKVAAIQAQFTTAGDTLVFVHEDHSYVFHNDNTNGDSLVQLYDVTVTGIGGNNGDILVA